MKSKNFKRRVAGLFISALIVGAPALAQLSLNVRDADIRAFIQDAAKATGRTFIIDSRVQGKVSVVTDRPLSKSEYFEIFLSTLRANGLVAVPASGGSFRIQPADGAAGQPTAVGRSVNRNSFVTEVIRLRAIDAQAAMDTIRPLVSKDGMVSANRAGRSLVVADYADNIARIRQIIARIDTDTNTTTVVALSNAGAREIAGSLQTLLTGGGEGAQASATVVAIDSSNSIAIRGDSITVAKLVAMAQELDKRAAAGTEVRVYWLDHADADKLMPVLQQLLGQGVISSGGSTSSSTPAASAGRGGAAPTAAPAPAIAATPSAGAGIATRGPAVVTRYEGTNALIVAANADVQRQVGEVIRQLDTRRPQVMIEAIIVEIGDDAAKRLGVQFLVGSTKVGFAGTNYSNAQPSILTLAGAIAATRLNERTTTVINPNGSTTTTTETENTDLANELQKGAVTALQNATGGFGGVATQLGQNGVFGAILSAVQSDTKSSILSTPSITTLDNMKAHMLVGQEIPITTGQALSTNFDNQFRTVQRENVGIILDVTPQVSGNGQVKLFIKQEVSSIAGPVSSSNSDLVLNKREFETTVLVDNGEIYAIGGLLDENERRTIEKLPLLSDIPLIGELFKSRSKTRTKTNLVVFIRPTILQTREENAEVTARRYGVVRAAQKALNPKEEPSIDALVRDYMGAALPVVDGPRTGDQVIDGAAAAPTPQTNGAAKK
jgi:general secretion pathway protein D